MTFARPDMVYKLSHRIISMAKRLEADCIAVACPMCQASLDMYQKQIGSLYNEEVNMPIIYFTQLMGLAMNISAKELLLDKHITDPMPMLKSKGLV